MILVDSNGIIDALDPKAEHHIWALETILNADEVCINHIVIAEISSRFASPEHVEEILARLMLRVEMLDIPTAFRAGQAFKHFISRGGRQGAMLPDFLIGAHAQSLDAQLLTRDTRRFRTYFPDLHLITPETEQ